MNNIIALGDSLTFGYGIDKACTYTAVLSKQFPNLNIYNKGINGHSTKDALKRFKTDVLDLSPDLVFIWLGSNDSAYSDDYHCSLIEYDNNLRFMIESLQKLEKKSEIVIITPPPALDIDDGYPDFITTEGVSKYVTILCELVVEYDIELINFFEILLDKKENDNFEKYFQCDGIHLSLESYEILYKKVYNKMLKLGYS